jgi:hypothetical protein
MKPNVCSFGHVTAAGPHGLTTTQGTSFSSPLVAGFAACAWETHRSLKNMELFKEIEKSADLYPYFDYAHGYGVPQASYFINKENPETPPTFDFVNDGSSLAVVIRKEYFDSIAPRPFTSYNYLYYNFQNSKGVLDKYFVISVSQTDVLKFIITDIKKGEKLNVHYKKYTATYQF